MFREYRNTTGEFLQAAAAAAMKEAAEATIKQATESFETVVREKVYNEVARLAVTYVQTMQGNDPLMPELHIIIDDRRDKK